MKATQKEQPVIKTARLILRPFRITDAVAVQKLAGEFEIADTTANIPHPYYIDHARDWIKTHRESYESERLGVFAITKVESEELIGAVGLMINRGHDSAELGYWVGKPFWNQGYCTEASRALLRWGFEELNLNRIQARHFVRNPSSGRVMEKLGMKKEGILRQFFKKWGRFEDTALYSILRFEYFSEND